MPETFDGNANRSFSAVVAFTSRELIGPRGIDGGEMLAWASPDELLAHHLKLGPDAKRFWKDGFLLYTLWAMGDFCRMVPSGVGSPLYPYTRAGFHQFLRDHGSTISPEEADRRVKVFRAYNRFEVTIIRMVEKAGLKKSVVAKTRRSGRCCRCALRRRIRVYGLHCRRRIPHPMAVAGATESPRKSYAGPPSGAPYA